MAKKEKGINGYINRNKPKPGQSFGSWIIGRFKHLYNKIHFQILLRKYVPVFVY